jgi:hypothetical protein
VFFADRLLAGAQPLIADVRAHAVRNLVVQHAEDVRRAGAWPTWPAAARLAREAGAIKPARGERSSCGPPRWRTTSARPSTATAAPATRALLLNSELYGFTAREVALAAQIVRYQRKGTPGLDDVRSLARPGDHELVARCALLLRLATAPDALRDVTVARAGSSPTATSCVSGSATTTASSAGRSPAPPATTRSGPCSSAGSCG